MQVPGGSISKPTQAQFIVELSIHKPCIGQTTAW